MYNCWNSGDKNHKSCIVKGTFCGNKFLHCTCTCIYIIQDYLVINISFSLAILAFFMIHPKEIVQDYAICHCILIKMTYLIHTEENCRCEIFMLLYVCVQTKSGKQISQNFKLGWVGLLQQVIDLLVNSHLHGILVQVDLTEPNVQITNIIASLRSLQYMQIKHTPGYNKQRKFKLHCTNTGYEHDENTDV